MEKQKSGLTYALDGERPVRASVLGSEVTLSGMKPFFDTGQQTAATRETAPKILNRIKGQLNSKAGWQVFHNDLAAHGITATRNGGELVYTLSNGEILRGNEINASLADIETALGTTYRKARKLRKSNSTAPADIAQAEAPKAETLKTETVKTSETVADKDAAAAEDVKKLYEQGRALTKENQQKIEAYFRDSRIAKQLAAQVRRQGWNPAKNAVLQQLRQSGKGAKTAEAAAMMAIATILKMIPVFISDLSSLGNAANNAIGRFKNDHNELQQHVETLRAREDKIKMIDPQKAKRIYAAHRTSLVDVWSRQKNDAGKSDVLISAGIADRLRATGHGQSEIVAILQAGGEESSMAELSGYYAFSEKGDKTYEKHKQYISVWAKLEKDACKTDEQKQRNTQNSRNNGQQTRNTAQNKQKNHNNSMKM